MALQTWQCPPAHFRSLHNSIYLLYNCNKHILQIKTIYCRMRMRRENIFKPEGHLESADLCQGQRSTLPRYVILQPHPFTSLDIFPVEQLYFYIGYAWSRLDLCPNAVSCNVSIRETLVIKLPYESYPLQNAKCLFKAHATLCHQVS